MELNIQKYLRSGKSPGDLEKEFGVYSYEHPELPLVGFKYGLIESEALKFHPIIRECRGIVLERSSWVVVAYPFNRFFNLGEDKETERLFDWNNFICQEKVDGSLIIVYYYDGSWRVNTSGSFAQGLCYDSGRSWEDLFWDTSGICKDVLNINNTYIFELWTKYNKVVTSYKEPMVRLLSVKVNADNGRWYELSDKFVDYEAGLLFVKRPEKYNFYSINEIITHLKSCEIKDPTFEGFVLCDDSFRRIKVKSDSYKQMHRIKGNGQFLYRNIIPQLLHNNFTELSKNFPEWLEELKCCLQEIENLRKQTDNIWYTYQSLRDRKRFAKAIISEAKLPAMLFWLYDGRYATVEQAFLQSEDYLIKYFEEKYSRAGKSKSNGPALSTLS